MTVASTDANAPESAASRWVIAALSFVVVAAVTFVMYGLPGREGREAAVGVLPSVNATLNGLAGTFLVAGYVFIRRGKIAQHKACMLTAFGVSTAFLVTYLIHHSRVGSVPYTGVGFARTVYFSVLIPHIILAAAVVPLALTTIYRGWTGRYDGHRRLARWALPIWLYVSVSGVVVYVMAYHL